MRVCADAVFVRHRGQMNIYIFLFITDMLLLNSYVCNVKADMTRKLKMHLWNYSGRVKPLLYITDSLRLICTSNFHFSRSETWDFPQASCRDKKLLYCLFWHMGVFKLPANAKAICLVSGFFVAAGKCIYCHVMDPVWLFISKGYHEEEGNTTIPGALLVFLHSQSVRFYYVCTW